MTEIFTNVPDPYSSTTTSLLQQGNSPSVIADTLQVGAGNTGFYMDSQGLWLGNTSFSAAQGATFAVDMSGNVKAPSLTVGGTQITDGSITGTKIASSTITGSNIAANTITAGNIQVGTITASQISSGTITATQISASAGITATQLSISSLSSITAVLGTVSVGGIGNGNGILNVYNSSGTLSVNITNSGITIVGNLLRFADGTISGTIRGLLGCTSSGLVISSNGNGDVLIDPGSTGNAKVNKDTLYFFTNPLTVSDVSVHTWHDTTAGRDRGSITWGNGALFQVDATGPWIHINGNDKSAIMGTSSGYRALYCMESPEVWFMDFVDEPGKEDDMFLEVTEGIMHYVKCENGEYQVWRRRRGHAHKRFEEKTREEFIKNEKFLGMAKV